MADSDDQFFMQKAYARAIEAYDADEMPIGAVVVCDGDIIGYGRNRERIDSDPTAHAEVVAIRAACRNLGQIKLKGCTLYTTIYPCPMCEAASIEAGIERMVYGGNTFSYFRDIRHGQSKLDIQGPIDNKCRELFEKRLKERGKNHILNHENT